MRLLLVVIAVALAGCAANVAPGPDRDACAAPCELLVDAGPERAFEPDVAIDPRDPDHWIVGSTVFREAPDGGAPHYLVSHVTFDGGRTWERSRFPGNVGPEHPLAGYTQTADPALAILRDGTAVYAGMGATAPSEAREHGANPFRPFDVFVARSTDGGLTWPEATIVARGAGVMGYTAATGPGFLAGEWPDGPWIASGPDDELLLTWHKREATGGPHRFTAMAAVSSDGGRTWSAPATIHARGDTGTVRPAVDPDGTFWVGFREYLGDERAIWIGRSADGVQWTTTPIPDVTTRWTADFAFTTHAIHVVMVPPPPESGIETPRVLTSTDGGATWRAVDLEAGEAAGHASARIVAGPHGAIVTYYHALADGTNEYRAAHVAHDGAVRIEMLSATPIGESGFVAGWPTFGDYVGLDADAHGAVAAWVGGAPPAFDVYAARIAWESQVASAAGSSADAG